MADRPPTSLKDIGAEVVAETTADGNFRASVGTKGPRRFGCSSSPTPPGFGVDWVSLDQLPPDGDVTLRLVKDVPIVGRVVNTEGQPVAGAVSGGVRLRPPWRPLDGYLAGWKSDWRDAVPNRPNGSTSSSKRSPAK